MTLRRALTVLALTILAALSGCGDETGSGSVGGTVDEQPDGTTYVVTGVTEDDVPRPLVPGTEVRVGFDDGRLTVTAGCNTMSGTYTLDGTTLSVEPMSMTEMGCDPDRMAQDTWLAGLFAAPVQLVTGPRPTLTSGSTVLALADRRTVSPDLSLVGTKWLLDSIGSTGASGSVSSVPGGVVASATFEDGQVLTFDGCNGGSAPLTVDGDRLVVGERVQTLVGCLDARAEVSEAFNAVLAGTVRYSIEEQSLTLTKGDRTLGFRAVDQLPAPD